ncbi:MAG: NIPSNAP family protein [Dehalococcoidia bacterium]
MIYELRIYEIPPGMMPAQHKRFAEVTMPFFAKHGIKVEWFANPIGGEWTDRIYYLLAFDSLADRERKWAAFNADEDWQRTRDPSGRAISSRTMSVFLQPTPYSPGGA